MHLRHSIHSEHRLAIFLRHIAHGTIYTLLADLFACGKSTVSDIVRLRCVEGDCTGFE